MKMDGNGQTVSGKRWRLELYRIRWPGCGEKKRTGIVSVVGAGGKTTVIRRLREECLAEKIPHIVSTTTHMQTGPEECFVKAPDLEQIKSVLEKKGTVWMGIPISKEKMGSFPLDFLINVENLNVWMFLEADGAKVCRSKRREIPNRSF